MLTSKQKMETYSYYSDPRVIEGMISHTSYIRKNSTTEIDMNWVFDKFKDWFDDELCDTEYWDALQTETDTKKEFRILFLHWLQITFKENFKYIPNLKILKELKSPKDFEFQKMQIETEYQICNLCKGRGVHVNPSIDCGGITGSEWAEWDPEEREMYLSGGYNQTCNRCNGQRMALILKGAEENSLHHWCEERLREHYKFEHEYAQERAAELKMGC